MNQGNCIGYNYCRGYQRQVRYPPQPQTLNTTLKTAYKLNKTNCKIDWSQDATTIGKYEDLTLPAAWIEICIMEIKKLQLKFLIELEHTPHKQPIGKRPDPPKPNSGYT